MIKIGFTGDFCPRERTLQIFSKGEWKQSFERVKFFFDNNELNVIDLECPLTLSHQKIVKTGPHLKADPATVEILNHLNCCLVATANNHFRDYGWIGMQDTYDALKTKNIAYVGSGHNLDEAARVHYEFIDGISIGFINVTDKEWSTTDGEQPGCNPMEPVSVFNMLQESKNNAHFSVVIAHGGHEHYPLPSPRMKKWYRFFVDAGADAVIGHHTHIISGFEIYKGAPVFYSLGNFCFDWEGMRNHHWNYGMLVRLKFELGQPVGFETFFVEQNNLDPQVIPVNDETEKKISSKLQELRNTIQNEKILQEKFMQYTNSLKPLMHTWIEPYTGKYLPGLHKKGLLPSLISKKKKQWLTVLIQCDTHRDVLLNAIHPDKKS